jgi:hypothetical protein
MAILESSLFGNIKGHIGKQIVFKKYGDRIVISKYPTFNKKRDRKKLSMLKKLKEKNFKDAMVYARKLLMDPNVKKAYAARATGMQNAHNVAVKEYLDKIKTGEIVPG